VWIPVPERGVGPGQPGGWAYQILPQVEAQAVFDLGANLTGRDRLGAYVERLTTPLPLHHCPSRRPVETQPYTANWSFPLTSNILSRYRVAKNDYAVSIGDAPYTAVDEQPFSLEMMDSGGFPTPDLSDHTGISHRFSEVRIAQVSDGLSNTYALGEKYLSPDHYEGGVSWGDDQTLYQGHNSDLMRTTHPQFGPPRPDQEGLDIIQIFGSAHASGFQMAMCDGSVDTIAYDIDLETHRRLGHRADGGVVPTD